QTVMHSGISAGCLTAIVLNLLFNHLPAPAGSPAGKPVRGGVTAASGGARRS
ncbi:purine permease, partial [Streptomyces sp. TRM76130]|nr:purine permease [Streptomyces sp. TRM76130]